MNSPPRKGHRQEFHFTLYLNAHVMAMVAKQLDISIWSFPPSFHPRGFLLFFSYLVTVFPLKEHWFESVSPEDFRSQVGATALCGHCCGLHHALKYDHHLQLRVILQGLSVDLVEGGLIVNLMDNRHRRDQEDSVSACVKTHVDVGIVQWKEFALLCNPRLRRIEGEKAQKHNITNKCLNV